MGVRISVAGAALMWAILRWQKTGKESALLKDAESIQRNP
jgi:hypothetical protein